MLKKLLLTFFFLFSSFTIIYPSKKENTNLLDYCYSFEKILSRNSVEKSKNLSNNLRTFANDIASFGSKRSKGALAKKIIDEYKNSKNSFLITIVPNQFYCFGGYWIEEINPGTFKSILVEKSKETINEYTDIKKEVDKFIEDINSEYKSIKIEIKDFF